MDCNLKPTPLRCTQICIVCRLDVDVNKSERKYVDWNLFLPLENVPCFCALQFWVSLLSHGTVMEDEEEEEEGVVCNSARARLTQMR